jgi:hypothetical protein
MRGLNRSGTRWLFPRVLLGAVIATSACGSGETTPGVFSTFDDADPGAAGRDGTVEQMPDEGLGAQNRPMTPAWPRPAYGVIPGEDVS